MKNVYYLNIFGLFLGIVVLLFGLIGSFNVPTVIVNATTYGGDAYTGIQNASASTANNITYISRDAYAFVRFVVIISGFLIINHYCKCIALDKNK
ncbi:MAG TPA: hypothetical protein PLB45_00230 [Bacilli bacterium]|jgi:hypothetical protein|nr:hypothetical protein [Bacilli bacterium]HPZ23271.1 hypothetical protein [Bacilli bacterium]HQC83288.1 hypothetical protein [Bacilli bacterium]